MIPESSLDLVTSDGVTIEGLLAAPPEAQGGVVLCHPHPLYGGDMDNPVVTRCREVCAALRLATLRFNFRGVGGSTGSHGQGLDERLDVLAALARLRDTLPDTGRTALIGYSFGATVAAHVALNGERLAGLGLIAPPLALAGLALPTQLSSLSGGLLVAAGTQDEYCPPAALREMSTRFPSAEVRLIDGANHFFFGKLFPLGEAVATWTASVFGLDTREPGRGRRPG